MTVEAVLINSEMVSFEQLTIDQPSWTIFPVHFLQKKAIMIPICCNLERTFPKVLELSVLTFLLIPCIPLQHHIIQLKFICLCFFVINFLDLLLQFGCVLENFISCLLQVDHLIQPSLHGIFFTAGLLKKSDYRGRERGRKYCISSINKLKWWHTNGFFLTDPICPKRMDKC